jgi:hypothetical protein
MGVMLAPARNDDSSFSGPAPLDATSLGLASDEAHGTPSPEAIRPIGERLKRALEQGGVPQLLRRGLNRVASPWVEFGSVTFYRRRLDREPEIPRPRPGLSVLEASLDDIPLVLQVSDPRRTDEIVRERLGRGDLCFLALDAAGRPTHSGWATRLGAHVPELERDVVLRSHEAYLYDAFTPPARRGHGAFGFVLDHLFAKLQALGARVVYSYVRSDDPKGQRSACVRLRPVGTLAHVRLCGRAPLIFGGWARGLPTLVKHLVDDEDRCLR